MHLTGTRQTLDLIQENAFLPAAVRALLTSGPWRNLCTEFTPHGPTLVMSVIHTIEVPFLLPLRDENRRV